MSIPFGLYGRYYDLLYQDKDYAAEADYVDRLIRRFVEPAQHALELGCGTGRHAVGLAERGLSVTGVERSNQMMCTIFRHQSPYKEHIFLCLQAKLGQRLAGG